MKYFVVLAAAIALSACNTVRGAGEDVAATGNIVSNAAESTESSIEQETAPVVNPY